MDYHTFLCCSLYPSIHITIPYFASRRINHLQSTTSKVRMKHSTTISTFAMAIIAVAILAFEQQPASTGLTGATSNRSQLDTTVHYAEQMLMSNATLPADTSAQRIQNTTMPLQTYNNSNAPTLITPVAKSSAFRCSQLRVTTFGTDQVDLIIPNVTSPSHLQHNRTNVGHTSNSSNTFTLIWQAPNNDSLTSIDANFLAATKDFHAWAKVAYYWAKIVLAVVGSVYSLCRVVALMGRIRRMYHERQGRNGMAQV